VCRASRASRASRTRRVERVELRCSTSSTQPKCMGSTRRTCRVVSSRVESSQVEFGLITITGYNVSNRPRLNRIVYSTLNLARQLEPRSGDAGADAADTGLMERAEWAEPGSMTDSAVRVGTRVTALLAPVRTVAHCCHRLRPDGPVRSNAEQSVYV